MVEPFRSLHPKYELPLLLPAESKKGGVKGKDTTGMPQRVEHGNH